VEGGGHSPEGSGAKNFRRVSLEHQNVQIRETLQSGAHGLLGTRQRRGEFADFWDVAAGDNEMVEGVTKSGVRFGVGKFFSYGQTPFV